MPIKEVDVLDKFKFDVNWSESENDIKSVLDAFLKIPKERFDI
jgi:hypothetical protein